MPKSGVLLYSHSIFNATAISYKLIICKGKIYCIVLYEIAILLTHFMKAYFNSFDNIQFFLYIFTNCWASSRTCHLRGIIGHYYTKEEFERTS